MIAPKDNLPLIQLEHGEVMPFETSWLLRSLVQAAQKAGYQKWWLAEHVAESITAYLQLHFDRNVVNIPQLTKAVQSVLQVIGYSEVASQFVPDPPFTRISLLHLVQEAGSGYELAFFDILGRRIHHLHAMNAHFIELFDLEPCIRKLRAKKSWGRDCDALREEIVSFVRKQTDIAKDATREVIISLC